MITSRPSGAGQRNSQIAEVAAQGSNLAWLRSLPSGVLRPGSVLLLGGSSVSDFRLRVAQSHLRSDLLPAFWSQIGIVSSPETFLTVPVDEQLVPPSVAARNAIHECPLAAYDRAERYPNIAVLNFVDRGESIVANVRRLQRQRGAVDLPQLLVAWLGFVWGAGTLANPFAQAIGMPGAAMVETAFGMAGIELTPGVAASASCPEAVWQSAIWWHEYYEKTATADVDGQPVTRAAPGVTDPPLAVVPSGAYVTRQPAAAVIETE